MKDQYRFCASVMLFRHARKSTEYKYEFLLLHKPRKSDAWQLPQGGVEEGESYEEAAMRELQEEAGVKGEVLHHSKEVYEYDFPKSYRRFRPDHICGQHIEFVFALLREGEIVEVDENEIDKHVWITPDEIPKYIRRKEYVDLVQLLLEESAQYLP